MQDQSNKIAIGDTVCVRRYEVTGSLDPADGKQVAEWRGRIIGGHGARDGSLDLIELDTPATLGLGYVFLGKESNQHPGVYLVTTVEQS